MRGLEGQGGEERLGQFEFSSAKQRLLGDDYFKASLLNANSRMC